MLLNSYLTTYTYHYTLPCFCYFVLLLNASFLSLPSPQEQASAHLPTIAPARPPPATTFHLPEATGKFMVGIILHEILMQYFFSGENNVALISFILCFDLIFILFLSFIILICCRRISPSHPGHGDKGSEVLQVGGVGSWLRWLPDCHQQPAEGPHPPLHRAWQLSPRSSPYNLTFLAVHVGKES